MVASERRAWPGLLLLLLTGSCDRDAQGTTPPAKTAGPYRLVREEALQAQADLALPQLRLALTEPGYEVFAVLDPQATGRLLAEGLPPQHRKVVAATFAGAAREAVAAQKIDAAVELPDDYGVAIELLQRALDGAQLPPELRLGPTLWTPDNLAAGGLREPAPADFALATVRASNGAPTATPRPVTVAVILPPADEATAKRRIEAARGDAKHPRTATLSITTLTGDPAQIANLFSPHQGTPGRALLVVPSGDAAIDAALADACRGALAKRTPVAVVERDLPADARTIFVGSDDASVGRACGDGVRSLLPYGGPVACAFAAPGDAPPSSGRRQGFGKALGLP